MIKYFYTFTFFLLCSVHGEDLLTLKRCQEVALAENPSLKASEYGVYASQKEIGKACSTYYPQVGVGAHASRWQSHLFIKFHDPDNLFPPSLVPRHIGPTEDFGASVFSSYVLYDSGKRFANLRTAQSYYCSKRKEQDRKRQEILLNTALAFYDLAASMQLQEVAKKDLERSEQHLKLVREKHEVGAVPKVDLYRAQADFSASKNFLVTGKSTVSIKKAQLAISMGLRADTDFSISTKAYGKEDFSTPDLQKALAEAVNVRPEIIQKRWTLQARCHEVKSAKAERGPVVSAKGAFGLRDDKWKVSDQEFAIGVDISMPLFTGFYLSEQVKQSRALYSQHKEELNELILEVQRQVTESYNHLMEAYDRIETAVLRKKDAEEGLRLMEKRYAAGSSTFTDLLDAQTAFRQAKADYVETIWSFHAANTVFEWTKGSSLEP